MQDINQDVLYTIFNKDLSINDLVTCKKVCKDWYSTINNDYKFDNILNACKYLSDDNISDFKKIGFIVNHKYGVYLLPFYTQIEPNYDFKHAVFLALTLDKFSLVETILSLKKHEETINNTFWNDFMVIAATSEDIDLAKFCISKGADNLAECYFAAKNYKNEDIANFFIMAKSYKANIDLINNLFVHKQHKQIYEFFK